jgi:hypothetical protein
MKKISLLLTTLLLTSCTYQHYINKSAGVTISELTVFEPTTSIHFIKKGEGNKSHFDEDLTKQAQAMLSSALQEELAKKYHVNVLDMDEETYNYVSHQLYEMSGLLKSKKKDEVIYIPPSVDSVMQENNIDYAVLALHTGFSREHGNYGAQVAKGILLGIVTLGSYYTVPTKAASHIDVFIVDGTNKTILFHNISYLSEYDPCDPDVLSRQVNDLFQTIPINQ